MHYDFILIGQGVAGTLLSYELKKRNRTVLVVDDGNVHASAKVAGGVLNPVNGKALWQTNKQKQFQEAALQKYQELELDWGISLCTEMSLLHFHTEERLAVYFEERSLELPELFYVLTQEEVEDWKQYFHVDHGIGAVNHCYLIAARKLLAYWRMSLIKENALLEESWDWSALEVKAKGVAYKGITAAQLVCCEGAAVRENPFFKELPFTRNKGEALLVSIPELPRQFLYQHGIRLTPWDDDLFWVGSNQTWDYGNLEPDKEWAAATMDHLRRWLRTGLVLSDHLYAERPTTAGQVIFAGRHPEHPQVLIFNGLGTRGFSAGPFVAEQLATQLCDTEDVPVIKHKNLKK